MTRFLSALVAATILLASEALAVELTPGEAEAVLRKGTDNIEAYDAVLRANRLMDKLSRGGFIAALELYEKAIGLDPNYAAAYAGLGLAHWWSFRRGAPVSPDAPELAAELAHKSVSLGDNPMAHRLLARINLWDKRDHVEAVAEARRAVALDPNDADSLVTLAEVLVYAGESQEALENALIARRLDPYASARGRLVLGWAYFGTKKYDKAIDEFTYAAEHVQSERAYYFHDLAAAQAHAGRIAQARETANRFKDAFYFSFALLQLVHPYKDPADLDHLLDGLRKAGVSE